jgi:thiol-disulfide isomerase/thioredoxin
MKNFLLGTLTGIAICFLVGFGFYKKFKSIQTESIKESIENSTYNFPQLKEQSFSTDSLLNFNYTINNNNMQLVKDTNTKLLLINYWATWCKPCIEEMPYLDTLYKEYSKNDMVKFICLTDEETTKVEKFKNENNFSLPFASYTKKQILPTQLLVEALPTTIVFNLKTQKYYKHEGSLNWNSAGAKSFINNQLK